MGIEPSLERIGGKRREKKEIEFNSDFKVIAQK
jgi:hypothetical protein